MDIVERLRREGADAMSKNLSMGMWKLCAEAADEIERLRKECEEQYKLGQYVATQHIEPARGGSANLL